VENTAKKKSQGFGRFMRRMKDKISSDKLSVVTIFPVLHVTGIRKNWFF